MIETNGVDCAASKFEIDLMPDHSVRITLRCNSAYEAALLFDEIDQATKTGALSMSFQVEKRTEIDSAAGAPRR